VQREPGRYLGGLLDAPLWADWVLYLAGLAMVAQAIPTTDSAKTYGAAPSPPSIWNLLGYALAAGLLFGVLPAFVRLRMRTSGKRLHWFWHLLGGAWLAMVSVVYGIVRLVRSTRKTSIPVRDTDALPVAPLPPAARSQNVRKESSRPFPIEHAPEATPMPAKSRDSEATGDQPVSAFEYDVALSFAGEDRAYVQPIARILRERGIRVFYDEFALADTWGADLYKFFDEVFRKRARYAVLFISEHYVRKVWPLHETASAQARALISAEPYLLPIRLDDSQLSGLRPTVGFIDARTLDAHEIADLIITKCVGPHEHDPGSQISIIPLDDIGNRDIARRRPPAWEYLLFAGVLVQRKNALETKWRDHVLRLVSPSPTALDDLAASAVLQDAFERMVMIVSNTDRIVSATAQTAAFGAPGYAGDPDQIEHIARRLMDVYESMLDWSRDVRSLRVSDRLAGVPDLAADLATQPLQEFRAFVDRTYAELSQVPEALRSGREMSLTLDLTLTMDQPALKAFTDALKRAGKRR
jgi:hypothetical protein